MKINNLNPNTEFYPIYQNRVKTYLEQALAGRMLPDLIRLITTYVSHGLIDEPQHIFVVRGLNAVTCGRGLGKQRELLFSQVLKDGSTIVVHVTENEENEFVKMVFLGPRVMEKGVFSIAREPNGVFHFQSLFRVNARKMFLEWGRSLIPQEAILPPQDSSLCSHIPLFFDPYSEYVWSSALHGKLVAYAPRQGEHTNGPNSEAASRWKSCDSGFNAWGNVIVFATGTSFGRMVVITSSKVQLFATTEVSAEEECRECDWNSFGVSNFYVATCTPDRSHFFTYALVSGKGQTLVTFKVEKDRLVHLDSTPIDGFVYGYICSMDANATTLALVLDRTYLFWDIESRKIISHVAANYYDTYRAEACWLTEGNIFFVQHRCGREDAFCLFAYDFCTPPSQKSPVVSLLS